MENTFSNEQVLFKALSDATAALERADRDVKRTQAQAEMARAEAAQLEDFEREALFDYLAAEETVNALREKVKSLGKA